MVHDELTYIVADRRRKLINNECTSGGDLLAQMLLTKDENGKFMNNMEISNSIIIGLLVANYEIKSSTFTSVLKYLAELSDVYEKVLNGNSRSQNLLSNDFYHFVKRLISNSKHVIYICTSEETSVVFFANILFDFLVASK